ncbi:MAG: response regulator [Elusimicrobia bacterium]|nr:response regulator [Elusimicrobiota bacterium]
MATAKKILVVEDEPDFRSILTEVLIKEGYRVVAAPNGEEGLKLYLQEKPDLLLLDVHLPDMEGTEICRKIRKDGPNSHVPIFLCTVRSEVAPVAEGLASGATDYVIKPFEVKDLLSRIAAVFEEPKGD